MVAIKGHFDGKVFVPDEPVDFPRGQTVIMHVAPSSEIPIDAPPADQHILDWIAEKLVVNDAGLPSDGSLQHDHYLYGTPKRPVSE